MQLHLRTTHEEADLLKGKARAARVTLTRFILQACSRRTVHAPDLQLARELRHIGLALDEIAKSCASEKWVIDPRPVQEELARITDELTRITKERL